MRCSVSYLVSFLCDFPSSCRDTGHCVRVYYNPAWPYFVLIRSAKTLSLNKFPLNKWELRLLFTFKYNSTEPRRYRFPMGLYFINTCPTAKMPKPLCGKLLCAFLILNALLASHLHPYPYSSHRTKHWKSTGPSSTVWASEQRWACFKCMPKGLIIISSPSLW